MKKLLLAVLLIAGVAGTLGYVQRTSAVDGVRNVAQQLLDRDIKGNVLKVGYVDAPALARIPIIGHSTWRSYFFVTDMKGDPVDIEKCPGTIDYEVQFSDREVLIRVLNMYQMYQAQACSHALQASKS